MSDSPVRQTTVHADKYSDPRVKVSATRWLVTGLALLLFAVAVAVGSAYSRRTRLGQTTEFWGEDTITALQLADKVHLLPGPGQDFATVELTATPGLGHLRRALLDERHFLWESEMERAAFEGCDRAGAVCVRLRFADPVGKRVPVTELALELQEGWVGPADGEKRVRVNDRVRPALRHQLVLMMGKSAKRYDVRETAQSSR